MGDNNWYNKSIVMQYIHTVTIRDKNFRFEEILRFMHHTRSKYNMVRLYSYASKTVALYYLATHTCKYTQNSYPCKQKGLLGNKFAKT